MRVLLGLAGTALWMAACGGSVFSSPNDDGGTIDGGSSSPCPASQPSAGVACTGSVECEYPGSAEFCTTVVQCVGGKFQNFKGLCTPGGPTCPPDFKSVPQGSKCSPETTCDYVDGRCGCSLPVSGPVQLDAGLTWHCTSAQPSCPALRPLLGTPCTKADQVCDYGACSVPNSGGVGSSPMAVTCKQGYWQRASIGCPL
jgi:hypothetical protein